MKGEGHNLALDEAECLTLLRQHHIGRLGWAASAGPTIQPVVYAFDGTVIVFGTAPGSLLSELADDRDVCLEIDDLDEQTANGWSVLVRGTSAVAGAELAGHLPTPWAPGDRPVVIAITPRVVTGRAVSAD